jgi:hypothetical protein
MTVFPVHFNRVGWEDFHPAVVSFGFSRPKALPTVSKKPDINNDIQQLIQHPA